MSAYATLDVAVGASADQIKKQYRKLSLVWHPDRQGGNSEKFQEITRAYEMLQAQPSTSNIPKIVNVDPGEKKGVDITLDQAYTGCAVPIEIGDETCYLEIPAGVDTGEVFIIRDKKIRVRVVMPPHLQRRGLDVSYVHSVTLKEALCGTTFEFDYVNGQRLRIVNQNTVITPQYKKTIPHMGMKRGQNQGSLCIEFIILFPKSLSSTQISAISSALESA